MIRTLIIDDEPLAREGMADYVQKVDYLQLVGLCEHPMAAVPYLDKGEVDLMLLDIHMPQISGIDFLKSLQHNPMVILTTAYPSYALEGYQLDVMDYLVKPITFARFLKAVNKARQYHQLLQNPAETTEIGTDYFFVKCEQQFEKIFFKDLLFVESMQNYVIIQTRQKKYISLITLKSVLSQLPVKDFMQIHKSFIVGIHQIDSVKTHEVQIGSFNLPVSRTYRTAVHERIVKGNLLG